MILVFIEHKNCVLNKTSLEAVTAAQSIGKDLGLKVSAVIPCDKDCALAQDIAQYDLEKVILAKNEKLGTYTPDAYADAWEQVIKAANPQYVVMSHTYQVRDFAPKVAARLGREVVGDCIRYKAESGKLVLTRRIFLGKLDADVTIGGDAPYFVTFQSGAFRGDNAAKGTAAVETMEVSLGDIRMWKSRVITGGRVHPSRIDARTFHRDTVTAFARLCEGHFHPEFLTKNPGPSHEARSIFLRL